MKKKSKLLLALLLSGFSAFAQLSPEWRYLRPSNTGVGAEEHNFISDDRFGNIWTGGRSAIQGEGAVVRFNHEDTVFTSWSNFEGYLPSEFVFDAEIDANDHLWVATGNGLCKYDGTSWTVYNTSNTPLPSDNFRSITFDQAGVLWVTFMEINFSIGGIASFNGSNWTHYTPSNSNLPSYQCVDILIDSQNNKWIRSSTSVTKFDGLNFIDYNSQNSGLWGPQVYDIALDSLDRLYAVTDMNGIYVQVNVFDGNGWSYINYTNTPALGNHMYHRIFIRDEKLIIAETGGAGAVTLYDGLNWSTHFSGDMVNDVFIDRNNVFWVAGVTTLSKLTSLGWRDYERYSAALAEHHNYDIFVDNQDRLWAANGNGGVQVFDCPKWQSYGPFNQGLYPSPQSLSTVGSTTCQDRTIIIIPHGKYLI
jgi:ligand-binding sensor domain-containing protein